MRALMCETVALTTAIDMYAFGMIAAELLLCRQLHEVQSLARDPATARKALVAARVAVPLADLVMHCLNVDPSLRPTAADAVRYFKQGEPFVPRAGGAADVLTAENAARVPLPSEHDRAPSAAVFGSLSAGPAIGVFPSFSRPYQRMSHSRLPQRCLL
jgi:serine/threonine protein kinase